MNNNNKLKAYIRFDGSGRVIPGSLLLQRFKPKSGGKWQEIDAYECCNYTTTTTTIAPTTTTTTTIACNCYSVQNNEVLATILFDYIDCDGNQVTDASVNALDTVYICARIDTVVITSGAASIGDNGPCGEFCPPL